MVKEQVVVVDISSSQVRAAFFSCGADYKISYRTRRPIVLQKQINFQRFYSSAQEALREAMKELHGKATVHPYRIFIVLSNPWCVSSVERVRREFEKPTVITAPLLNIIIDEHREEVRLGIKFRSNDPEIIENEVMLTRLNGYPTDEPFNQRALVVEMVTYFSASSRSVLSSFASIVAEAFHSRAIYFYSFPILTLHDIGRGEANPARPNGRSGGDYVVVNVGGETTEVVVVNHGLITNSRSFPMGRNYLARTVADSLGTFTEEAASIVHLHLNGGASTRLKAPVEATLQAAGRVWQGKLKEVFTEMTFDFLLPRRLYLISDDDEIVGFFATIVGERFDVKKMTDKFLVEISALNKICQGA